MRATQAVVLNSALSLALGLLAALCAQALHAPLPWLLGPLLALALAGVLGVPLACPALLRHGGQWVIGTSLGLYFTPAVLASIVALAPLLLAGIGWALLAGWLFYSLLAHASAASTAQERATAYFAASIGGASEMTGLGERNGGRADRIAMAHALRVLIVVLVIPIGLKWAGMQGLDATAPGPAAVDAGGLVLLVLLTLGGALLCQHWRWPNPFVLGALGVAMALTASGVELSALPAPVSQGGQLLIACALGARFTPAFLHSAPRWLAAVALGSLLLLALSAALAWGLAWMSGLAWPTVLLGTSPGGVAEMCITAKVLQLGVPTVTAFHVTRYLAVLLLTAPIFRWLEQRRSRIN